jgi:hypothetical protein
MSTNSTDVGMMALDPDREERTARRGSGTATVPTLGSMVQNGKLAASALPFSTSALNRVDW